MQMITKQDLQEEHHHQLSLSMSSMSSLHHDQTNQNIFGVPNCLQAFFNTGLCGAILTTIVGSISWRLVASAFSMDFLSSPITCGLLRICYVLESTGVASGAWVLAALHRRVIAFPPDEEYIGTAEERALDKKVLGHGDGDTDKEMGGSDDNTNHKHDYGSNKDDDDSQSPDAQRISTLAPALDKTQGNKRGNGGKTKQSGHRQYNLHQDVNEAGDVYDTSPRSTTALLSGNQQEQCKQQQEGYHHQLSRAGLYDSMSLVHYGSMSRQHSV